MRRSKKKTCRWEGLRSYARCGSGLLTTPPSVPSTVASRFVKLPWNAARVWLPRPIIAARDHRFAACSFPVRWPRPLAEIPYRFPCAKVSGVAGIERRHIGPQLQRLRLSLPFPLPRKLEGEGHGLTINQLSPCLHVGATFRSSPRMLLDLPRCGGRQNGDVRRAVPPQLT
jgi:hypothetical protein